jgi:hypothetical protein
MAYSKAKYQTLAINITLILTIRNKKLVTPMLAEPKHTKGFN